MSWVRRAPNPGAGTLPPAPTLRTLRRRGGPLGGRSPRVGSTGAPTRPFAPTETAGAPRFPLSLCARSRRGLHPTALWGTEPAGRPGELCRLGARVSPRRAARAGSLCISVRPTQNAVHPVAAMGRIAQRCRVCGEQS